MPPVLAWCLGFALLGALLGMIYQALGTRRDMPFTAVVAPKRLVTATSSISDRTSITRQPSLHGAAAFARQGPA